MKNRSAYKTALLMANAGYWSVAILFLRKAYGK
ncbi:hypothetical protein EAIG_04220 [Escherichia coli B108]|jgi:hypothetical protein|nr:hypothetical protein EAIG_04220 [Escherichia coli B108]